MKKIVLNKYVRYGLFILAGLFIGWLFFHSGNKVAEKQQTTETKQQIWTCAMHPQIRMNHPGKCPICGMELIPVTDGGGAKVDSNAVHFTKEAAELANVATSIVSHQRPSKEVRLYGKVQADERLLQNQVAHIGGRIEKLFVNFTGEPVR
ncbi:MAG: heavy metal-binding domain-containing protein, partial [Paludibacter sp.]